MSWTVHKFGGTSLATAEGYRTAARIVSAGTSERTAVVVSAMSGVTDTLLGLIRLAAERDAAHSTRLRDLRRRELELIGDLLGAPQARSLVAEVEVDFGTIEDILRATWHLRSSAARALDLVAGYGELWSARILAAHLAASGKPATWLDARDVLVVEPGLLAPVPLRERSRERLDAWLAGRSEPTIVIPGFVASDVDGLPTTLGRNGSDYSASIFADLLEAETITIWTDVDGVLSADPRRVPDALVLDELSYDEAMELAYFGAKVIHPATMTPAVARKIPIFIRNTFHPDAPGTKIHLHSGSGLPVKGLATIDGMTLVNVEGSGMIGVPGIAERLFGALREAGVSVTIISQGSSEHSICFAVPDAQAATARKCVERAFFAERQHGQIQDPELTSGCTVLAVVGDNMAGTPGISGRLFGALGKVGVNVRAVAQGSSERNISIVIDGADATRALRAVHSGFYLSAQTLSVGVVGPGLVGATLLEQIRCQLERLRTGSRIDLRVRGIATRGRMLVDDRRIDLSSWRQRLDVEGQPSDLDAFARHVQTDALPHAVLIDCTADRDVAALYAGWLERGIHVITPSKVANTGTLATYRRLRASGTAARTHYLYETTVGAGLPILQTLRDLIETGDEVLRIEGILSGTLSYLFNLFDGTRPFSAIVEQARTKGYTEPDPREDLSGMDVARKVVILAREMGLTLELADVAVSGLVSAEQRSGSIDDFLRRLPEADSRMTALVEDARRSGEVLRYVGVVDPAAGSSVRLARYPESHPFARVRLTDNIVLFRTRRYHENPLVVQGPGAGPEVTAAGVFADLLRLASFLGG